MDECDKGKEMGLMEQVLNNGEKMGAGGVRNFFQKMIWMNVTRGKR
jgi:hypothetical protein